MGDYLLPNRTNFPRARTNLRPTNLIVPPYFYPLFIERIYSAFLQKSEYRKKMLSRKRMLLMVMVLCVLFVLGSKKQNMQVHPNLKGYEKNTFEPLEKEAKKKKAAKKKRKKESK